MGTIMNHTDPEGGWEELDVVQPLSLKSSEFSVPLRTELYQAKTNVVRSTFAKVQDVRAEMEEEHVVIRKRQGNFEEGESIEPQMELEEMAPPQPPPRTDARFRCC